MAKVYLRPESAPLNIVLFNFSLITFTENKNTRDVRHCKLHDWITFNSDGFC